MGGTKKKLMIVDGHAVLHRAWHALPPLTTKTGEVVSGAYGFTMTLLNAVSQFQPTHLAVTFDLKGPTFRHHEFEAYKATRVKQAEEFYLQVPLAEKILQAMGIPVYTASGYEADDVISTISEQAKKKDRGLEIVIVTGDLDTLQLVDDRTRVFTMRKGISDTVVYDAEAVAGRYGLRPDQMVDYKALRGDPSDNIPGVKGIGEVTAAKLIGEFGSLDKLFRSLEKNDKKAQEIKPAVREKLLAHKKDALQARELCRLRRDAPIEFSLEESAYHPPTRSQVAPIFEELQFNRLLQRLPDDGPAAGGKEPSDDRDDGRLPSAAAAGEPVHVSDGAGLDRMLEKLTAADRIAFRSLKGEQDGQAAPRLSALGLTDGRDRFIVDGRTVASGKEKLAAFFASGGARRLVCHDLKNEINAFAAAGLPLAGDLFDLMIASYLCFSGQRRHSLSALLSFYRNLPPEGTKVTDEGAARDRLAAELPHLLPMAVELEKELAERRLTEVNRTIELPLAPVLARMERLGIAIDIPYYRRLSARFGKMIAGLEKTIHGLAGETFNINSPRQVQAVLFDKLGLSPQGLKKTAKSKALSTAASELEKLRGSHPIIDAILSYRELTKLVSTYVEALPGLADAATGRIHASFNQAVTATGRLSSSDPNLQNIPTAETEYGKMVRDGFVAGKGCVLMSADYSQIELRIAAHIAGEEKMIRSFRQGEDIHWRTAAEMWGEKEAVGKRRVAKVINFGILYGMGPQRLAESAGIAPAEAREYIDRYFALHPGLADYIEATKAKIRQDGYVETLFGRRRFFPNFELMNQRERAEAERQAINMPIQGTQADMIKLAMVGIDDLIRREYGDPDRAPVKLLIQVHDELIFEVREDLARQLAPEIVSIMTGVKELSVPVAVNVSLGRRWGSMKPLE